MVFIEKQGKSIENLKEVIQKLFKNDEKTSGNDKKNDKTQGFFKFLMILGAVFFL